MTALSPPRPARPAVAVRRHIRARDVDIARMTRYRGGTYSHTVDMVVFTDGSSARTDLIRLNPNVEAYSLDFTGHAPTGPSHYRAATWSAVPNLRTRAHEAEVDWILRNSFPALSPAELSRRLRSAGYPLGSANIAEHEAIAATQAAIWHFTNDLNLDNRPLNVPVTERRTADGIVLAFDGEPELGGYSVELASRTAVSLILQKSVNGHTWRDVAASGLNVEAGKGTHRKALGVGSTVSRSRHGRRGDGYRYYRLVVLADSAVTVGAVRFWLTGSRTYRNPHRIVHLYDYLLGGARRARESAIPAEILSDSATVVDGLVGPFRLQATGSASLTAVAAVIVDDDGRQVTGPVEPGTEFYVRPQPGADGVLLTAIVPATSNGFGGRVITGVARDDANSRLTPVALAMPTPLVVDFAIYLEGRLAVAG
jgi:TQXA domain-containing protein